MWSCRGDGSLLQRRVAIWLAIEVAARMTSSREIGHGPRSETRASATNTTAVSTLVSRTHLKVRCWPLPVPRVAFVTFARVGVGPVSLNWIFRACGTCSALRCDRCPRDATPSAGLPGRFATVGDDPAGRPGTGACMRGRGGTSTGGMYGAPGYPSTYAYGR